MEIDPKLRRQIEKRLELSENQREIEVTEVWMKELEAIYRKKYESLAAVQIAMKSLIERMNNRVTIMKRIIREESMT
jgi:hypothetical protein